MIEKLKQALPKAPIPWLIAAIEECPKAGIDTPNELASFLAQCAHESNEFTQLEENLNYSDRRLAQVSKQFAVNPEEENAALRRPNALAIRLHKNPEDLANYWYDDANRGPKSKLGNIHPGDGWRYHGRGPIQITGFDNYKLLQKETGLQVVAHPEILLTPTIGIISACWYWKTRNLDAVDDDKDMRLETRKINGGEIGLQDRQKLFNHILMYLEAA